MIQHFNPIIEQVATFEPLATVEEMAVEPMLHGCSLEFAREHCGPLTRRMLNAYDFDTVDRLCEAYGLHIVIDSRVSMLMPGMYPSIPGWHCDAIPRPNWKAQPDFSLLHPHAGHYIASISTFEEGVSQTELLLAPTIIEILDDESTWKQVHRAVEGMRPVPTQLMEDGEWLYFNPYTIHRATPAKIRGWRNWIRLSMYHNPPLNKISNRTQIYIISEENGW